MNPFDDKFIYYLKNNHNIHVIDFSTISGGCVNSTYKIKTKKSFLFIKINSDFNPFPEEVKGLEELSLTNTFYIPNVVAVGNFKEINYLILEYVDVSKPSSDFWINFSNNLASLHRNYKDYYGLDYNNYIGSLDQKNTINLDGIEFFINSRLLCQLKIAGNNLPVIIHKKFENLFSELYNLLSVEPACLLHGDLWSGNYLVNHHQKSCLIDPAIYYGNREVDISMTKLFGGFPSEFYHYYNNFYPLNYGWEDRVDIWNLYPLLVHFNLFGNMYLNQIDNVLNKYI